MSKENEKGFIYRPENYLRTGVNLSVFTWLAVLGIPALLLFLIYSKVEERATVSAPPSVQMEQVQPH